MELRNARTAGAGVLATLCAITAFTAEAKDATYLGSVQVIRDGGGGPVVRGTAFLDRNRNSRLDIGETGVPGVMVSNGREVVRTDAAGTYALPAYDDMNVFITKPAGYAVPVSADMVPQFNYVHKTAGSPDLRFGGIAPTGPLPGAINFPLIGDPVGDRFECLVFGDTQSYTNREVSYVRDTVGTMLAERDNATTECLIFEGDVMGDDLSLFGRFKRIIARGQVPQYYVAGNHDLDFDAASDAHSFDTFRREWGPEYYSFDIGKVHFVVLDDVRYPCNGVDDHPFCAPNASPTYNAVIHDRQLTWLRNDLAHVPEDRLLVLNTHIPFVSYSDATTRKHQIDNLAALHALIGDRAALGLSGHTHTTEQILPGEHFAGWREATGTGLAPFHQIVTGAVSGSWWAGDLDDHGIPHATQRLGAPRGYYVLSFDGASYVDTYRAFGRGSGEQFHAAFNTPRFRRWAEALFTFADGHPTPSDTIPPVTVSDLGDPNMVTVADLEGGTWLAVNVWNGSRDSRVTVSIDDGHPVEAARTQPGTGERARTGPEFADPWALAKQATQGRLTFRSTEGGDTTAGFTTWRGVSWQGAAGPFQPWMLTRRSNHLWRADLPRSLPLGVHTAEIVTTDRYGRTYSRTKSFEVVDPLPEMGWPWKTGSFE
ncbi:MAG: calcineurin-like phosphoesterase family protein [Rhodospirillales bacterium]|nr:calcineurin-like phosphoesterase family protein [Rhodospirillales bacterium]